MLDWKNIEDYEFAKKICFKQWAWEFLRRSEQYRIDYNNAVALQHKWQDHNNSKKDNLSINPYSFFNPQKDESLSVKEWVLSDIQDPRAYEPFKGYGKKWGIRKIQDPFVDTPPEFISHLEYPKKIYFNEVSSYYGSEDIGYQQDTPVLILGVDVRLSWKDQQKKIRDLIKAEKKKRELGALHQPKPDMLSWITKLRVLDAVLFGAKNIEIARVIYKDNSSNVDNLDQSIYDFIKNAKDFANNKYRIISLNQ